MPRRRPAHRSAAGSRSGTSSGTGSFTATLGARTGKRSTVAETLTEEGAVDEERGQPKLARASRYPQRELDANQFSAAVLMPRALVESEHAWLDRDIRRLADAFGVSTMAMEKRLWFLERYLKSGLT